jgi:predicted DNA-binding ribbon-helix-helix protein
MDEKIRAFELNGNRRQIRLDTCTWDVIDLLAKREQIKWAELARHWVQESPTDAKENLTATVRAGAMAFMLKLQMQHDEAASTAVATATAATKPGSIRIDWATTATNGAFFLDSEATNHLLQALKNAQLTTLANLLEATGPSEQDREYQRMYEEEAARKAELKMEEDAEQRKQEEKVARDAEAWEIDREAEAEAEAEAKEEEEEEEEKERLESQKLIDPKE